MGGGGGGGGGGIEVAVTQWCQVYNVPQHQCARLALREGYSYYNLLPRQHHNRRVVHMSYW